MVPCTSERGNPPAITRERPDITINVVHFESRLSRKRTLSSHFKFTSLSSMRERTVLRLKPDTIHQHLRTCVVLYVEVSVGTSGWHFITPQSSFY